MDDANSDDPTADERVDTQGSSATASPDGAGSSGNVDPAELDRQLSEIKGAMGLEERYPGQRRMWPVYGAAVAVVMLSLNAAFVFADALPDWLFFWLFVGFAVGAALLQWRLASKASAATASTPGPDFRVLLGTLLLGVVTLLAMTSPVLHHALETLSETTGARLEGGLVYGLVIAVAGMGFLFTGTALAAYRIRKRDRYVFYAAGVWMLVYAAAMPNVALLGAIGYGLFGVLFFIYSLGAYVALGDSGDPTAHGQP